MLALRSSVISEEPETLQQEYVSAVQHHELFGMHFFHIKKVNDVEAIAALPTSMVTAFNSDGLHFYNLTFNSDGPPSHINYSCPVYTYIS